MILWFFMILKKCFIRVKNDINHIFISKKDDYFIIISKTDIKASTYITIYN